MAQVRQDYQEIQERDALVVVIGSDDAPAFAKYWSENDLPFIGLPDPTHSVLKLYGQKVNLFKFGRMPAQVVVDKTGTARYVHYGHSMSDIPTTVQITAVLDHINVF